MKHTTAFTEIVILIAMLVGFIPLLMILMHQLRMSEYTFLEDKTQIEASAVTYKERIVTTSSGTFKYEAPNLGEPRQMSLADIVMCLVIFDEYAPDSNVVCVDGRYNKSLDMTVYDNFINRDDYISNWYNTTLDVLSCSSSYVPGTSKPAHSKDTVFYLNYIPKAYVTIDKDGNTVERSIWSFDHNYLDRIGVE